MGGIGSGRRLVVGAKDTTNDYRSIDVRRWQRDGLLSPDNSFMWEWLKDGGRVASICVSVRRGLVVLDYQHRRREGVWKKECYPVRLDWTSCHFGFSRPWFICPAIDCGRRVAILYGGEIFACRHCYQLVYASQREIAADRLLRKADKIRDRMRWEYGILGGLEPKPKGMHWRTYNRLCAEHDILVEGALKKYQDRIGIVF